MLTLLSMVLTTIIHVFAVPLILSALAIGGVLFARHSATQQQVNADTATVLTKVVAAQETRTEIDAQVDSAVEQARNAPNPSPSPSPSSTPPATGGSPKPPVADEHPQATSPSSVAGNPDGPRTGEPSVPDDSLRDKWTRDY